LGCRRRGGWLSEPLARHLSPWTQLCSLGASLVGAMGEVCPVALSARGLAPGSACQQT